MAGAGQTKPSFWIECLGYVVVGLPLAFVASTYAPNLGGLRGLWLAVVVTHLLVAAAYVVWFRRGRWADARTLR
jgi:Na+-driven multidrug efflux pump